MHVLEQMQRRGAATIKQFDVGALNVDAVRMGQAAHQRIELGQARRCQAVLRMQGFAQVGQVGLQLCVGVGQQPRQHAQADRDIGK